MYSILFTKKAQKDLDSMPTNVRGRVVLAIDELTNLGTAASNIKKLQTPFPGYRKRVGDYRILFECNDDIIIIYKVSKRSEVYR